jgi:tripartite-type tricarboxylate transporter receptor subunit TctC
MFEESISRRGALHRLAGVSLAAAAAGARTAYGADARQVRLVLPISAGSGVDTIVRASVAALSKALKQPVDVVNEPGGGGVNGTLSMIRSAPDGQTLGIVSNSHVIFPSVLKSAPFDPVHDVTPIAVIGVTPLVLVANPRLGVKDLGAFVGLLKSNPGKFRFGSPGTGTILHLAAEMFKGLGNLVSTHVPYGGFGAMLKDLSAGEVGWGVAALPAVASHIRSGALTALCVASLARSAAAAEIPTSAEAGQPFFMVEGWFAAVAPKGLPAAQVKAMHDAIASAYASAEVMQAMAKQGNLIRITSPESTKAFFEGQQRLYAQVVRAARIAPQ